MMLSTNLSNLLDIRSFYESHGVNFVGKTTNSREGKEAHGSCPRCGGNDRFTVWLESGRFSCSLRSSGCGWHGSSPYWFLRDEGYSHHQACDELGIDPYDYDPKQTNVLPLFMLKDEEPNQKWQSAAEAFIWRAERYLWSPYGKHALEYLQSRGLTEETIKSARLGYCPGWFSESLESWGLTSLQTDGQQEIKIPAGIIFPWFVEGHCWKIQVKRFETNEGYFQVTGSSDALFGIDALEAGKPVLLVEGEFDSLSVQQEAGDLVTAIATGGASKGQSPRWISKLKQASHVLIGFDQDENNAGENGAAWWLKKLQNSIRWTPWAHDVNTMHTTGISIRQWVESGLKSVRLEIAPAPRPEPVIAPPALSIQQASSTVAEVKPPYIPHKIRNPHVKRNANGDLFFCSFCKREQAVLWRFNAVFEQASCKSCKEQFSTEWK